MNKRSPLEQFERLRAASDKRSLHNLELAQLLDGLSWDTWEDAEKVLVPSHDDWAAMRDSMLAGLAAAAKLMRFDVKALQDEVQIELLALPAADRANLAPTILGGAAIDEAFLQLDEWVHFLVAASWRLQAARAYALTKVANPQQFDPMEATQL